MTERSTEPACGERTAGGHGRPLDPVQIAELRSLSEESGGDDMLSALVSTFASTARARYEELCTAAAAGDTAAARAVAHNLAGSAATLGASEVSALARAIEVVDVRDPTTLGQLVADIGAAIDAAVPKLRAALLGGGPDESDPA